jgi:uncharacterized RDD family membrane protein YckC
MSDFNPYGPSIADLNGFEGIPADAGLADRSTRFVAALIDGIIAMCYMFPILDLLSTWSYLVTQQPHPFAVTIAANGVGFGCFLLIHGYLLKKYGQTVGKKILGIRIADMNGNLPHFAKVIFLRYLSISLVTLIPVVGNYLSLVDVLFIFGSERRCVHDLLAGTKVVKVRKT